MATPVDVFYSKHAEKQFEQYLDDNLADEFLDIRLKFAERVEKGSVLDAGCGPGRDTEFFCEKGLESAGIDIASGMIEIAKENRLGEFKQGDIRDLTFEDNKFDGIWCSASIFFMPKSDMQKTLNEFHRVIKEDGILFVDFKKGEGKFIKEKWNSEVKEWHLGREEAKNMIENSGFKIKEVIENESNTGNDFIDFFCKPKESR